MTPRSSFIATNPLRFAHEQRWGALLASSLFAACIPALTVGCGGQSHDPVGSTDTGNPPVIAETKLRVMAADDGVVVSGAQGAVTAGAEIEVTNLSTNASAETTAEDDGSFEVSLGGSVADEYRVEASLNGKTTRTDVAPSVAEPDLDGHEFLLQTSEGFLPYGDTSVSLSFEDGGFRFNAGCNSHAGPYSLCDGDLCVTELSTTDIGCEPVLHTQDEWLADFITSKPSVDYVPPRLTLTNADATLEFLDREEADPDRPLREVLWTIDTFIEGDAASSLPLMNVATIRFANGGTFSAFDTCNVMSGDYMFAENGGSMTLSNVAKDERACETDVAAQEHIGQVLQEGSITFTIEANRLTLMRGELGLSATTE